MESRTEETPEVERMNPSKVNVLLVEDDPDYAELVTHWLTSSAQANFQVSWTDSLGLARNRLTDRDVDVILLDLSLPDSEGLATYTGISTQAPGVPTIILSAADSESLALRMIQDGAENYLVKSSCSKDLLLRTVRYAVVRHRAQVLKSGGESNQPQVLGVIGAKGGLGASTLACNLAQELLRQTETKVLLADLDIHAGSVAFQMGVDPKYSLLHAVNNIEGLDETYWAGIVAQRNQELSILASPTLLGSCDLEVASVSRVIDLARTFYRWTVLDLGPVNVFSRGLLANADQLFLVTTPAIPALYETRRAIDALTQSGVPADRIRLVVNQAEESESWSPRELQQMFGIEVFGRLPSAPSDLHEAFMQRRLPNETTAIRKEIAKLARRIAGLPEPAGSKRGLVNFFPFRDRSRKDTEKPAATVTQ